MEKIWIIGLGHFGLRALRQLSENNTDQCFVLADPDKKNLEKGKGPNRTLEQGDGVAFLAHHLKPGNGPDWIVPALPVHLAAEWCMLRSEQDRFRRVTVRSGLDPLLPNSVRGPGDIYVSHATFMCPENCSEPENICTYTKKSRKRNMFEVLKDIKFGLFESLVIKSCQLGPGVGGYRPGQLFELLNQVEKAKNDMLVSTACRCHGVITGLGKTFLS
ncbi:MAG: potassium transporter [Desulfobacteraceae bacterium]|nr:potassium transporter [Desulfobacteraceae bacterium]